MNVPAGDEVLTSAWLNGALESSPEWSHGTLEVVGATRIGAEHGLSGRIHRVVASTAQGGSVSFVVKQESAANVERELLFRRHCEELVRGVVPELLGGISDGEADRGVLLLEDIAPAEQGDVLHGCSFERAEAVVRALARVHGATWKVSDSAFDEELPRWRPRALEREVWLDRLTRASERFPEILTPRRRARLHGLPERVTADVERLRAGPASWIQVDAHLDNVLWRPDGRAVLLDWCNAAVGPPAVDLMRCLVEGMATPSTAGPLLNAYADEVGREVGVEPALSALVQGAVGWAGQGDLALHGRQASLCESFLRDACSWEEAEVVGL